MGILFPSRKLQSIHSESVPRSRSKSSIFSNAEKGNKSFSATTPNYKISKENYEVQSFCSVLNGSVVKWFCNLSGTRFEPRTDKTQERYENKKLIVNFCNDVTEIMLKAV